MTDALAKILKDWIKHRDVVSLLDENPDFPIVFANADIAEISANLTEDDQQHLRDIVEAISRHISDLETEALDIKDKIEASKKSMAACLSYGSSRPPRNKE